MKLDQKILDRLESLIKLGQDVLSTKKLPSPGVFADSYVNTELATQWQVSSLSLLSKIFGNDSDHYRVFATLSAQNTSYSPCRKCQGVLVAAMDDYANGFLLQAKTLIEAEVFDDFLSQAEELLAKGYFQPAAVVAGCVLEDGLKKIAVRNELALDPKATIDPINIELAKHGIYSKLVQKKITALADIRNNAAHGNWAEFNQTDVTTMIYDIRRFMEEYFS